MPNPQGNPDYRLKYGERTKVVRLPESIANAVTLLLDSGVDTVTLLQKLAEIKPLEEFINVTARYRQAPVINPDTLRVLISELVDERLAHQNSVIHELKDKVTSLEVQREAAPVPIPEAPKKTTTVTPIADTPIFTCPHCQFKGSWGQGFKKDGFTKQKIQRWKCCNCNSKISESNLISVT